MKVATGRDWRVVLLAVGGGAGGLLCLGLAAATAGYPLVGAWRHSAAGNQLSHEDLTGIFVLAAAMSLLAVVLFATMRAALSALRGRPDNKFSPPAMPWWTVLMWIAVWLGASILAQILRDQDAGKWLTPILHVVAIASPIYVLIRLAIAEIGGGSKLRLWGSLSTGMLLGTGLAAAIEIMLLMLAIIAAGIYLIGNPQQLMVLQRFAAQLARAAKPEESLALLRPILTSPLALLVVLGTVAGVTPLVEEVAKSIPTWLLHRRVSTGAQGFWVGALSGAGFALLEGLLVSADTGEGLAFILMLRAGSSLMHIFASGLTGWGIGVYRASGRATRILAGYLGAVGIHAGWNAVVVAIGYGSIRASISAGQPDPLALGFSVGGGVMLMALIVLLAVALIALNRRFRSREAAMTIAGPHDLPTPPPWAAGTEGEAS